MPAFSTVHLDVAKNHINLYSRVSNRRDSLLINYSVFYHLANSIQHSPFINFGEFCQSPVFFQTPHLLILADS